MDPYNLAVNAVIDSENKLVMRINPGVYKKRAGSGYPEVYLPSGSYPIGIDLSKANADPSQVLAGQTFYSRDTAIKSGTMPNLGSWSTTISPGSPITIPAGYHNGYGTVTPYIWNGSTYLYFMPVFQGGYGNGPIANHTATLIADGGASHEPGFLSHESSMYYGSSNICGAGMVSIDPDDDSGIAKLTALATILNIFTSTVYYAGNRIYLSGGTPACFRFA